MEAILATGRCYWETPHLDNGPLRWADERAALLEWEIEPGGRQQIQTRVEGQTLQVLRLIPPCYVDVPQRSVGPLAFDGMSGKQAAAMLAAPAIPPEQADAVGAPGACAAAASAPAAEAICPAPGKGHRARAMPDPDHRKHPPL